tara:strand:- start:3626 stop:4453 length:828 start_codon:yes stop_codon:yes gene_type:complete
MAALELLSPAKLNLFLHITGRRADGLHELQTLFQLLDWGDTLSFSSNESGKVRLSGDDLGLAADENLITRAATLLQCRHHGAAIHVSKRIPPGGGLGGGSSNAATTLLALNHLWRLGLTRSELIELGASLGADVPVFVAGHTAWAEGTGDILTPLEVPERWYLIVAPDCHVSTAEIFSHRQLTRNSAHIKIPAFFQGYSRNDCQRLVRRLYPEVDNALSSLETLGEARLTGTGACAFVAFDSALQAREARNRLPDEWHCIVARGVNESPVTAALA